MPEELVLLVEKRSFVASRSFAAPFIRSFPLIHLLTHPIDAIYPSFLFRTELATIVYDPAAHHSPTPAQLEAWDASRRQDIAHHQLARLERRRKTEDRATAITTTTTTTTGTTIETTTATSSTSTTAPIDVEHDVLTAAIQQKRAEREARRRQRLAAAAAAAAAANSNAGTDADVEADADAMETLASAAPPVLAPVPSGGVVYTVSVPMTSDSFAWYDNDDDSDKNVHHMYETLDAARTAGVWSYPASADERARCEVFRDLWEKGYYMGGGVRFGGDWLVYPGACTFFFFFLLPFGDYLIDPLLTFPSHLCRSNTRRSAALSFALRRDRANIAVRPVAPDGSRSARSARYSNEEGASFMWLGP
jgi:hypothetical protein